MAFARIVHTDLDGSTDEFDVTFPYISQTHVKVELNGTLTTDFTFISSSRIQMDSMPASGDDILIYRATSPSTRLVDYQSGSILSEEILDTDSLQAFYLAQEANDVSTYVINKDSNNNWDATNSKIVNVANPTSAQDAATKAYTDTQVAGVSSDASAAAASASAAATSATNSAASAATASSSASTATTKASEASASAAAAAASAESAGVSLASQAEAEAGTNNTNQMTPLRTKQAVDAYGLLAANDLSDVASASTARTNLGLGTAATLTAGTSANNAVQLDGSGALPAISGANLTNLPASGGTVDLTASGAVTAGKTLVLNSDGTVSQIAQTSITQAVSSSLSPTNESAPDGNYTRVTYMTTPDVFFVASRNTVSSTLTVHCYVVSMASNMSLTETVAPTAVSGSPNYAWGINYDSTHDRVLLNYQLSSSYRGTGTASYSSANGLDIMTPTAAVSSNYPYGAAEFLPSPGGNTVISTGSTSNSLRHSFATFTKGSDASADTLSFGSDSAVSGTNGSASYNFYMSPVWFPDESKLLIFRHDYSTSFGTGNMDYRVSVNHGDLTGSGSSASYTSTSHVIGTVSGGEAPSGTVNYYPDIKRAVWTDGRTVETFSMNGGFARSGNSSTMQTQDFSSTGSHSYGYDMIGNLLVVFGPDLDNSSVLSYWTIEITTGATAASDTFTISSATAVNSDTVSSVRCAYNPDHDGFLVWTQPSSGASKLYGVQIARTTTNVNKLTSLSGRNYIGFASNSASDGGTVTVQLPSSVATPTQGSLTVNELYYVKDDGTIGTSDAGYGIAGRAISSTQLVVEENIQ